MRRRLITSAAVLLIPMLVLAALWFGFDRPPPRLIVKYGFPPTGGPTGRTMTVEGVEFVELRPGYFWMGSHFLCENGNLLGRISGVFGRPWGRQPKHASECPPHWVEIQRPFWMAVAEISNEQYERYARHHERTPATPDDNDPVVMVSWHQAVEYCHWLTGLTPAFSFALPSEAQLEYACRAGSSDDFTYPVDTFQPQRNGEDGIADSPGLREEATAPKTNIWGLTNMLGNVYEWCQDAYREPYQRAGSTEQPWEYLSSEGTSWERTFRVVRGGSWVSATVDVRPSARGTLSANLYLKTLGFRPVAVTTH